MHADDGLIKHIITDLKAHLCSEALGLLDANLKAVQPYPGLHRPTAGLSGALALSTCTKTADILKLLPIALISAVTLDQTACTYIEMLQGELLRPCFTNSTNSYATTRQKTVRVSILQRVSSIC